MRTQFGPCGQIVEYLNHCYSTTFRLWIGGIETIVPARWYFAPDGAKLFSPPNAFCSNVYAKNMEQSAPGPGEVDRNRVWDDGHNPGYLGQCFAGEPEWFGTGELPASVLVGPTPGFDPCCNNTVGCLRCVGGRGPATMRLVATGGTGISAAANGIFQLPYIGDCNWSYSFGDGRSWTVYFDIDFWLALYEDPGHGGFWGYGSPAFPWTCFSERDDVTEISGFLPGTAPAVVFGTNVP